MLTGTKILCVDDDEDDLFFIREAIKSITTIMEIAEAKNGRDAIDYLQLAFQKSDLPNLIIMDMNMPKMNGKETIAYIKTNDNFKHIPLVIFTTSSSPADKSHFESSGVHFITKPFDYQVFSQQIVDLLNTYQLG